MEYAPCVLVRKAGLDRRISTPIRTVRRALKLGKRDKIHYTIRPSGEVVLTRAEASDVDDPVLGQFLGFLAADIARHPERLQALVPGQVLPAVPPFFRYHAPSKVIVYAWVNDEDTKRAYENSDDAYRVFRKMLESGRPPDDWDQFLA